MFVQRVCEKINKIDVSKNIPDAKISILQKIDFSNQKARFQALGLAKSESSCQNHIDGAQYHQNLFKKSFF